MIGKVSGHSGRVSFAKDALDSGASLQSVSEALCHKSIETTRSYYKSDNQSISLAQRVKADHVGNLKVAAHDFDELDLEDFDFDSIDEGLFQGSCSSTSCFSKPPGPVTAPIHEPHTIPPPVVAPPPAHPSSVPVFNFYFGNQ